MAEGEALAIILGDSDCVFCGNVVRIRADCYHVTPRFVKRSDPRWKYGDKVVHWRCWESWEGRFEACRTYVNLILPSYHSNPIWHLVHHCDLLYAVWGEACGEIKVVVIDYAWSFRVRFDAYDDWAENRDETGELDNHCGGPEQRPVYEWARKEMLRRYPQRSAIVNCLLGQRDFIQRKKDLFESINPEMAQNFDVRCPLPDWRKFSLPGFEAVDKPQS